jgi:hypothetical protein
LMVTNGNSVQSCPTFHPSLCVFIKLIYAFNSGYLIVPWYALILCSLPGYHGQLFMEIIIPSSLFAACYFCWSLWQLYGGLIYVLFCFFVISFYHVRIFQCQLCRSKFLLRRCDFFCWFLVNTFYSMF